MQAVLVRAKEETFEVWLNPRFLRHIQWVGRSRGTEVSINWIRILRVIIKVKNRYGVWMDVRMLPNILEEYIKKLKDYALNDIERNIAIVITVDACLRHLRRQQCISREEYLLYYAEICYKCDYPPPQPLPQEEVITALTNPSPEVCTRFLRGNHWTRILN